MKITPPAEDSGVESLKRTNADKQVTQTPAVAAASRIAPLEEYHAPPLPPPQERRLTERRHNERRNKRQAIVLETRTTHERRLHDRRALVLHQDGDEGLPSAPSPPSGIDEIV